MARMNANNPVAAIQTGIGRHLDERTMKAVGASGTFWKSQDQGAATILVAAFNPELNSTLIRDISLPEIVWC